MSAYMVDEARTDALVDIAKQYNEYRGIGRGPFYWRFGDSRPKGPLRDHTETEIGRMPAFPFLIPFAHKSGHLPIKSNSEALWIIFGF